MDNHTSVEDLGSKHVCVRKNIKVWIINPQELKNVCAIFLTVLQEKFKDNLVYNFDNASGCFFIHCKTLIYEIFFDEFVKINSKACKVDVKTIPTEEYLYF